MKSTPIILVLTIALASMLTANIQARATNPSYLSQFPSVERVKAEIKGSDPIDTAARQQEAFWLLNQMITELAGQRFDADEMTGAENDLRSQYGEAFQWYQYKERVPALKDQPRWRKLLEFYEKDPGFLDELLNRFFTPALRAKYYQVTGKRMPQLLASQVQSATSSTNGTDPDIAKAKAAKVDTRVFGMLLGDSFKLS
jgi:hypothetical protein